MTLDPAVVYRIYNNEVAVVLNVKTRSALLLTGPYLTFWKRLVSDPSGSLQTEPAYDLFVQAGIVPGQEDRQEHHAEPSEPRGLEGSILNYWAFQNRIPLSGHFELTERCNLRCKHCYCLFQKNQDTLSTGDVFRIVDDLKRTGTLGLVLTGGEIFLRKDILAILSHLHEAGIMTRLNSNGTLIDEGVVTALEPLKTIYRIHISLYGATAEIHDRITRVPGSFQKTLRALHLLKEAEIPVRINCSVMRSNFEHYPLIEERIGKPLHIPVHLDAELFPKDDGSTENLSEQISEEQLNTFQDIHKPLSGESGPPKLCKAGFSFFSICEDGTLYPCLKMKRYFAHPLGDLKSESFHALWHHGDAIAHIRTTLKDQLRSCPICTFAI